MSTNPLLSAIKVPGESFQLPSLGLFYHDGELDDEIKDGVVHVYPMRSIDKINLSSGNLLATGDIIKVIFEHCVPEVKKPEQLCSRDVQFLLTCMHVVTYGPTMDIIVRGNCTQAIDEEHEVDLRQIIKNASKLDPTTIDQKFTVTLDNGQVIKLKPMLFHESRLIDEMSFKIQTDDTIDLAQLNDIMLNMLSCTILSIDGVTNREHILEWMRSISDGYIQTLRPTIERVGEFGLNELIEIESRECPGDIILTDVVTNNLRFFT